MELISNPHTMMFLHGTLALLLFSHAVNGNPSIEHTSKNISSCHVPGQSSGTAINSTNATLACSPNTTNVATTTISSFSSSFSFSPSSSFLSSSIMPTISRTPNITSFTPSNNASSTRLQPHMTENSPVVSNSTLPYAQTNTSVSQVQPQATKSFNETFEYTSLNTSSLELSISNETSETGSRNHSFSSLKVNIAVSAAIAGAQQAVFAHFMLSNTQYYTISDWENDISLARDAHIDGFALNMARNEKTNGDSLDLAFRAANNLGAGFKLFFSFDYAGNGLWDQADVIALINKYKTDPVYFMRGSQPLVSTFEGPLAAPEWPAIKDATGCFFMPSWSSLGARKAVETGVVDGLFNWASWPNGPHDMLTTVDASYHDFLDGKPYMMPVSPWFFTNMPGFRKNWLWRGDDLWFDRWQEVIALDSPPDYLEIITWNDWGESHYIGPLREKEYHAFERGKSPFNYAEGMPHDGWREFLPYLIDSYKNGGVAPISREGVVAWYRLNKASACPTGGTTGNTASQLQTVYPPSELAQDKIFFSALLTESADVSVRVGSTVISGAKWENVPDGGIGMYHGSVPFGDNTGTVAVTITRRGVPIVEMSNGRAITAQCAHGIQNWNAWVGSSLGSAVGPVTPALPEGCIEGTGEGDFATLCAFTCKYDYCPSSCTCTALGKVVEPPTALGFTACPKDGLDVRWLGLCSYSCNRGFCPSAYCTLKPKDFICIEVPAVAPPVPICIAGSRQDTVWQDLCAYTCRYGFCPPEVCDCLEAGASAPAAPATVNVVGYPSGEEDFGLCDWACAHGFCPSNACSSSSDIPIGGNGMLYFSPKSATVIPFPQTSVPATATFTVGGPVISSINIQPNLGEQNQPSGPGAAQCGRCDLLRLLTSTCCGIGGGVSNPIEISAFTPLPRTLDLLPGFIPFQQITSSSGNVYPPGIPLPYGLSIPAGTAFPFPFRLPAGTSLGNMNGTVSSDDNEYTMYIISTFWEGPHTVTCAYPCMFLLPPITKTTTWTPTPFVTTISGTITTISPPVQSTELIRISKMTVTSDPGSTPTKVVVPIPALKPLCIQITLPIIGTVTFGICPPDVDPFPPPVPEITIIPVPPGKKPGPTNDDQNTPTKEQKQEEQEEEEEDQEEEGEDAVCELISDDMDDEDYLDYYSPINDGSSGSSGGGISVGAGVGSPSTTIVTVTATALVTVGRTSTLVVTPVSAPTPAVSKPPVNPSPPKPDPKTEVRKCLGSESVATSLKKMEDAITIACYELDGLVVSGNALHQNLVAGNTNRYYDGILVGVLGRNNCEFKVDRNECIRILTSATACSSDQLMRTGAVIQSNCAAWTLDPVNTLDGKCVLIEYIPAPCYD